MSTPNISQRSHGMSLLDYLWINYGNYHVDLQASNEPREDVLLTEKALTALILKSTKGGIVDLKFEDDPYDPTLTRLIGHSLDGSILTVVRMPKEVHVVGFAGRKATLEDIDNGFKYPIGSKVLAIVLSNGDQLLVSLEELNLVITGGETNTIFNEVTSKGVVKSNLKLDLGNDSLSVVKLKTSNLGLYASLNISQDKTGVDLIDEVGGLKALIPLGTTGYNIKFENLTLAEYMNIPFKDRGTIYFISDKPYIYLGTVRYGVNMEPGDAPIVSLVYDLDTMTLAYKRADRSDIRMISLGPVSDTKNGMMTKELYIEIRKLKVALDGIVNVKDYVRELISTVGVALEWGNVSASSKELLLKNGYGDTISKIDVDVENYLKFAESRPATEEDVYEAKKQGVTLIEGSQALILTLSSNDKVYVSLQDLIDVYVGRNSKSISLSINNHNEISADLNISEQDKMLHIHPDGVATHLTVVRSPRKVTFYGKTLTEKDKIGEFTMGDPLIKTVVIKDFTEEIYLKYPPRTVDGKDYDRLTNPLKLHKPYIVMCFGDDTGDPSTSFYYNDYISLEPIVNSFELSPEKGNMLERDKNGYLYCSLKWINV